MRIAMVSCWKYRDAWEPFSLLFQKHWPGTIPAGQTGNRGDNRRPDPVSEGLCRDCAERGAQVGKPPTAAFPP